MSLSAIALLVLNDHVLKGTWPGTLTGKLSDIAGLVFFPLLLLAFMELTTGRQGAPLPVAAVVATGLCFALIQTSEPAADLYRAGLSYLRWPFKQLFQGAATPIAVHHVPDPTDLIALPALLVAWGLAARPGRARGSGP